MSAEVRPVYVVYCADCNNGDGPHDDEDDAQAWADEHDAEYHNEPDRTDAVAAHRVEPVQLGLEDLLVARWWGYTPDEWAVLTALVRVDKREDFYAMRGLS